MITQRTLARLYAVITRQRHVQASRKEILFEIAKYLFQFLLHFISLSPQLVNLFVHLEPQKYQKWFINIKTRLRLRIYGTRWRGGAETHLSYLLQTFIIQFRSKRSYASHSSGENKLWIRYPYSPLYLLSFLSPHPTTTQQLFICPGPHHGMKRTSR